MSEPTSYPVQQGINGDAHGFRLGPTLVNEVSTSSRAYTDETVGAILSMVRVDDYHGGLDLINASPRGNGTAIFTNDGGVARPFQHAVEVGKIGINVPRQRPLPITTRWLDANRRGLNLGFPKNH